MNYLFLLNEILTLLRHNVSAFFPKKTAPRAAAIDHPNDFLRDLWLQWGASRRWRMTIQTAGAAELRGGLMGRELFEQIH